MLEQLEKLTQQYKDNPYMLNRLHFHLTQILPKTLQNELQTWEKRKKRNKYLLEEQKIFIQIFLSKNDYYYLPQTSTFYEYDKTNNTYTYKAIKEDDVIYQLLSSISKDEKLMQWKYKTKFLLLKQIKERNLFQSIPETATIQRVLGALVPSLFTDKKSAKYFLTILGDAILKKSTDLIFLVKPKTKPLLQELDSLLFKTINLANVTSNIMTKYHESYSYTNCRLLKINTASADLNIIRSLGLDLICIATYYSHNRYSSSDNYLNTLDEQHDLKTYSLFLKNNTSKTIIDSFFDFAQIEKTTDQANIYKSKVCINWKNMHYIWKLYISKNSFPFMFYSNTLKNLLKERIQYDELADTFYGVTSKYLPYVSEVLHFWEETISIVDSPDHSCDIDELCELFKKKYKTNLTENDLIKIVAHFFPSVEIKEAKYILNISCSLWDKSTDIIAALDQLKESYKTDTSSLILIDDAYKYYLKFCRKNKSPMVANKRYFEQWIHHNMADLIQFEKFIKWHSETN
jgi:hypothetical protein